MQVAEVNPTQVQVEYAGFNRRVIALTIDCFLLIVIMLPIGAVLDSMIFGGRELQMLGDEVLQRYLSNGDTWALIVELSNRNFFFKSFIKQLLMYLFSGMIIVSLWWKTGTTPGKWIAECKILNEDDLSEPSRKQYIKRYLAYVPSNFPLTQGFLLLGLDSKHRAWHDRMVDTVVIVKKHNWSKIAGFFRFSRDETK